MIFILGGTMAGKSEFAREAAKHVVGENGRVAFFSPLPLEGFAPEVRARAEHQRSLRPRHWKTFEPPYRFEELENYCQIEKIEAVIFDSVSLWLGHEITQKGTEYDLKALEIHCRNEVQFMTSVLAHLRVPTLVTSGEVSEGVTPAHESGRLFRDLVSSANRFLALNAVLVCSLQAGIAQALKYPSGWVTNENWGPLNTHGLLGPVFSVEASIAKRVWA